SLRSPPLCPYTTLFRSSLDVMLDQLREANSEIVIGPERLREVLHELWIALGWIETTPYWQELEARDENLTPADHLDLAQRYEDRSEEHTSELQSRENLV